MQAIISDIHGNLEALEAVLKDIESLGITDIVCLGDTVGYGPNPLECLKLVREKCRLVLLGNHDAAVLWGPNNFNPYAEKAIYWTGHQLGGEADYFTTLHSSHRENNVLYVHGSPVDPLNEYMLPDSVFYPTRMAEWSKEVELCSFSGHTHMPGVFEYVGNKYTFQKNMTHFDLISDGYMVNVGSVGQPRDNDSRACYVVYRPESKSIEYRRVDYDIEATVGKIHGISDLVNYLGDRLRTGR
jgi:predicted phosphodiesterase